MIRHLALAFTLGLATVSTAFAADPATGDAIRAAVSGNTVQGSMADSGAYTEFYAADGTIKGKEYQGTWSIKDDTMCFGYGADPATCWNARIDGDRVVWVQDGTDKGDGTILPGKPNNF